MKVSIGKISKDLGFALMKLGLNIAKSQLPENTYWALNSAIEDSQLSSEITQRYTISADELSKLIQQKCKSVTVWCWDGKYRYIGLEDWRKIINKDTLDRMKYIAEFHDCLLPDTPVIVLNNGTPEIVEIQEVRPGSYILDYDPENDKLRWTRVNWIASKYTTKDIITIKKPEGFLQCTEDHKFYRAKRWYRIGELIKHYRRINLTVAPVWKVFETNDELIDRELAWAYGLFMAEGTANIGKTSTTNHYYQWKIDCGDLDALERAKAIFEDTFKVPMRLSLYDSNRAGCLAGGIIRKTDIYTLKAKGYGNSKKLALIFNKLFYTASKQKKVPTNVLLSNKRVAKSFLDGFIVGDGHKPKRSRECYYANVKSRVGLLGLQILCKKLGWAYSIGYYRLKDCPSITMYPDGITKVNKPADQTKIRGVYAKVPFIRENKGTTKVYDINTETHSFVASTYLVHNCDNFAVQFSAYVDIFFQLNSAGIAIGAVLDKNANIIGYHAWNCIVVQENDKAEVYFYEPQADILKKVESCIVDMDWAKYSADLIIFK